MTDRFFAPFIPPSKPHLLRPGPVPGFCGEVDDLSGRVSDAFGRVSRSITEATTEVTHVYVDGDNGSDDNSGYASGDAKKTLAAGKALLPETIRHNTAFHLSGSFSGELLVITNTVEDYSFFLVDGGDALTVVAGPFTSTDPETDTTKIGDSGQSWTKDQFAGDLVEIMSGPAAGTLRTIQGNTTTEIVPCYKWKVDPGPSVTFRVVRPATTLSGGFVVMAPQGATAQVYLQRLYLDGCSMRIEGETGVTHVIQDNIPTGFVALWMANGTPGPWCPPGRIDPDTFAYVSPISVSACGLSCKTTNPVEMSVAWIGCGVSGIFASFFRRFDFTGCYPNNWGISGGSRIKGPVRCTGMADVPGYAGNHWFLFGDDDANPSRIDNPDGVGLLAINSLIGIGKQAAAPMPEINDCGSHAIELQHTQFVDPHGIAGSGNAGAGVYPHSSSTIHIKDGSPPTLSGSLGDCSLDGSAGFDLGSGVFNFWSDVDGGSQVNKSTAGNEEYVLVKEVP